MIRVPLSLDMPVDTRTVAFRTLSFANVSDALAEAERLATAARAGTLRTTGNWTAGQTIGHLAWWVEAIDEDKGPTPPWFMNIIGPLMKNKILKVPPQRGFKLPGSKTGTYGDEPCELEPAMARLRTAYARLQNKPLPERHPVFGTMSRDEWLRLHCMHAELHLGYLST
jgi:hypothetical protein